MDFVPEANIVILPFFWGSVGDCAGSGAWNWASWVEI